MRRFLLSLVVSVPLVSGCAPADDEDSEDISSGASTASEDDSVGVPAKFDKNHLMDDSFYLAKNWMTVEEVQAFLEHTPYKGSRSWLADLTFGPKKVPLSKALVDAASKHGINPIMLLSRMQNEQGMVSNKFSTPPRFGLGCNQSDPGSASLDVQFECAAETLEKQFGKAERDENNFPVGRDAKTLDGVTVRPVNRATSALYAYTPWEGTKKGNGSYLAWQVVRKFAVYMQQTRAEGANQKN